ncbi:methyltransferase domain-containing protein [Candidatus Comchoanobacter bicostacola]|uniref:Methyltransferase domain-containing protein n=1 Tax=Candidatus Comchoanobacter bicostacola TaxID=2919598 RepID=A0ABY5DKM8_9GAMM|nr:methyltransferase domain-containing protein [Candidatus Comchoanobacter bicostacola]UTC24548.1 methyltransferase domain-containing protein [Candidatus Comchoanobacter bicostacola]
MVSPEWYCVQQLINAQHKKISITSKDHKSYSQIYAWYKGVLRRYFFYEWCCTRLAKKSIKEPLKYFLMLGMYRLDTHPDQVAQIVNHMVSMTQPSKAKPLVNAVLREYLRSKERLISKSLGDPVLVYDIRPSLLERLQQAQINWRQWIKQVKQVPKICILVNVQRVRLEELCTLWEQQEVLFEKGDCPNMLVLKRSCLVHQLPGYQEGFFSVVSGANQLLADQWTLNPESYVLDACAAPGGKSALIYNKGVKQIQATDIDLERIERLTQNMQRLGIKAEITVRDWTESVAEKQFDAIWLDVPCSATGVIAKHPEIAVWDRNDHLNEAVQSQLLRNAWRSLKPGGTIFYTTCSVLPHENEQMINCFLEEVNMSEALPMPSQGIFSTSVGAYYQSDYSLDVVYGCLLKKTDK